jgi:hypothetical protein
MEVVILFWPRKIWDIHSWMKVVILGLLPFSFVQNETARKHMRAEGVCLKTLMKYIHLLDNLVRNKVSKELPNLFLECEYSRRVPSYSSTVLSFALIFFYCVLKERNFSCASFHHNKSDKGKDDICLYCFCYLRYYCTVLPYCDTSNDGQTVFGNNLLDVSGDTT